MPQFDVFLSHSSVDKSWVAKLKADLQCYGVSAWLDMDEIRPGSLIVSALEEALDNSRAVALIVSPEAIASGWVEEEYAHAIALTKNKQRHLQLIPVILREAQLPGFLENRNWVDFRDETAYAKSVWQLVWGITGQKPARVLDLNGSSVPLREIDINRIKVDLAHILSISQEQINVLRGQGKIWQMELPAEAAELLRALFKEGDSKVQSLGIQKIEVIRRQSPQPTVPLSASVQRESQRTPIGDKHPLHISLTGQAVQEVKNELKLVVDNTSAKNYRQVAIQLRGPLHVRLHRTEFEFPLGANSKKTIPITLQATRAGRYELEVWASSIPKPKEGFLHTTLPLTVAPPPAKSTIEVEFN